MRVGWQTKRLIDVCQFINGLWKGEKPPFVKVGVIRNTNFTKDGTIDDSEIAYLDVELKKFEKRRLTYGDLILEKSGGGPKQPVGRVVLFDKREGEFSFSNFTSAIRVNDSKTLDFRFLHKFLFWTYLSGVTETMQSHSTGIRNLDGDAYKDIQIPLPPLPEQQRIVSILDESFDGIATAEANAKKNLQNVRALFTSHLQAIFATAWHSCELVRLADLTTDITDGDHLPPPKSVNGIPFITIGNIIKETHQIDFTETFTVPLEYFNRLKANRKPRKGDLLYTVTGSFGIPVIVNSDIKFCFQRHIGLVRPSQETDTTWLYYLLLSPQVFKQANEGATGTAQKTVSLKVLRNFNVPKMSLDQQQAVVAKLNALSVETQHLEFLCRQKLAALAELKASLLHKAFVGELTKQSQRSIVISLPTTIPNITTTDLHAGILAIACQLHDKNGKLKHYGHVKAEKIAHMVEAHLGIDLGRTPVKDAAGPNDYPHLMRVEHRARKAGFFDFQRVEGAGYRIRKDRQFDALIKRTREKLGSRSDEIDGLLELMLPMKTQQAEIFCTVYAAWNNLLLSQQQPTDEDIVFEARENWHPDKLKIPREKFFAVIDWLRERGVIPRGNGRMVIAHAQKQ